MEWEPPSCCSRPSGWRLHLRGLRTEKRFFTSRWTEDMHAWSLTPGEGKPRWLFPARTLDEWHPQVSPDGKWVAYESNESGKPEVYVVPASGDGGRSTVSTIGGRAPKWSHNGRGLFYVEVSGPAQLMAVDV